ncbi:F0F1 ATP synthase subunit A [Chloroflexota bacterium]
MPKLGCLPKVIIGILIILALVVVSGLFFPTPQPEVHLAANYGGEAPDPFLKLGPIYVTNTLIASWLSIVVLVGIFYFATRKMKLVPRGLQNLMEFLVEAMLNFVEGIAGNENGRRFFPIIATIFLFVLANAWLSLLPIFNVIGFGHHGVSDTLFFGEYSGAIIELPFLRSANTDINLPLMLALMSFVFVEYWGISSLGVFRYMGKFFRFGQLRQGLGQLVRGKVKPALGMVFTGVIDVFVGFVELMSEFIRLVSFTFRLFGNMTAGEVLLLLTAFLVPWVFPVVFYGLEFFFGSIQALIFGGLTLVFATMAVASHGAEH